MVDHRRIKIVNRTHYPSGKIKEWVLQCMIPRSHADEVRRIVVTYYDPRSTARAMYVHVHPASLGVYTFGLGKNRTLGVPRGGFAWETHTLVETSPEERRLIRAVRQASKEPKTPVTEARAAVKRWETKIKACQTHLAKWKRRLSARLRAEAKKARVTP